MPRERTSSQPTAAASAAPATAAATSCTGPTVVTCLPSRAAAYAPTPNGAAWPSDGSPATPASRSRPMASRAKASTRVSMSATLDGHQQRHQGQQHQHGPGGGGRPGGLTLASPARPSMPVGRSSRTTAMVPKTRKLAYRGSSDTPSTSTWPMTMAPRKAPGDRPEPAEDDHHQPQDQHPLVQARVGAEDRRPQHPAQAGQHHPEGEHGHHQPPGVDARGPGPSGRRPPSPGPAPRPGSARPAGRRATARASPATITASR